MKNETLARKLYETYCGSSDNKNFRGESCPTWTDLPAPIQKHWRATAAKATELVKTSRCVEKKVDSAGFGRPWIEIDFDELQVGDTYRMFEPDGSLVDGQAECKVVLVLGPSIKSEPEDPDRHNKELRAQINYIEAQLRGLDYISHSDKQTATRKMRMRLELLRLALETESYK